MPDTFNANLCYAPDIDRRDLERETVYVREDATLLADAIDDHAEDGERTIIARYSAYAARYGMLLEHQREELDALLTRVASRAAKAYLREQRRPASKPIGEAVSGFVATLAWWPPE